jgi:hypothetical protein
VALVDAADSEHRYEDLHVRDLARVAGKERFNLVWLIGHYHEVHPRSWHVHTRQLLYKHVYLRDHDPIAKGGGFNDRRSVLGVRTCIEVAFSVS